MYCDKTLHEGLEHFVVVVVVVVVVVAVASRYAGVSDKCEQLRLHLLPVSTMDSALYSLCSQKRRLSPVIRLIIPKLLPSELHRGSKDEAKTAFTNEAPDVCFFFCSLSIQRV